MYIILARWHHNVILSRNEISQGGKHYGYRNVPVRRAWTSSDR
jgi:hypothetical protein